MVFVALFFLVGVLAFVGGGGVQAAAFGFLLWAAIFHFIERAIRRRDARREAAKVPPQET